MRLTLQARLAVVGFVLSVASALAQLDPYPRNFIESGYDQPVQGQGPLAAYGFFYHNNPQFFRTNQVLRLVVGPTFLDGELGFRHLLSPTTDGAIEVKGGGFIDDHHEVRQGHYFKDQSFDGHGGGASLSLYQRLNPHQRIPLNAVVRGGVHYATFAATDRTAPAFQVPGNQVDPFVRVGLRLAGTPPRLFPRLGMEVSVWYERQWRLQSDAYGFNHDRRLRPRADIYWLYAGLDYAWTNVGHQVSLGLTAGGSAEADRFSAWRLGSMLPLVAEVPLSLPGYYFQELTARRFVHLSVDYLFRFTPTSRWQLMASAASACVDYLPGFEQPGAWQTGAGGGVAYTSPHQTWRVILRYGYGFNALRHGEAGAHSVGLLFQVPISGNRPGIPVPTSKPMKRDAEVPPIPRDAPGRPKAVIDAVRETAAPDVGMAAGDTQAGAEAAARAEDATLVAPRPAAASLVVLAVLGLIAFLYFAQEVVVPVVLASVVGMSLQPLVRLLVRLHIPRFLAAAIVLGTFIAVVSYGFVRLGEPAMEWVNDAPVHLEQLREKLRAVLLPAAKISQAAAAVANLSATEENRPSPPTVEVKDKGLTNTLFNWTGNFVLGLIETLVLLFLLLASGEQFLPKLVALLPVLQDRKGAVEISRQIQQHISKYLFAISVLNLSLGVVVGAGLYFMGVPNPALWGAVAAILNFVPYFGPFAGVVIIGMVGLLSFSQLAAGLLPPAWYLTVHLVEANLITPVILGRRFTMSPVVIFISLMFWMWLWGITGALVAVPLLVSLKDVCERREILAPLRDLLGGKAPRPQR